MSVVQVSSAGEPRRELEGKAVAVRSRTTSAVDITAPQRRHWADRIVAAAIMLVLLPVFVFLALMVKVGSRGPVFYRQDRVGLDGHLFPFFKFRTMVPDAHAQRHAVLGDPDEEMSERYRNDPRITGVGRFLRRWSLDELPQFLNVVRGEMALVGPRPMLPDEVSLMTRRHQQRHLATPGLTGLWQVSGRKETTWEERMELDLRYVQEQSAGMDLAIIGRTFRVILKGDGAY